MYHDTPNNQKCRAPSPSYVLSPHSSLILILRGIPEIRLDLFTSVGGLIFPRLFYSILTI